MADDDSQVIRAVLDGDREKFANLVTRYQGLVFTVVVKIVRDGKTAEDLLQETFLKAFRRLCTLKNHRNFKAWLVQIATNEALKVLRKKKPGVINVDFSEERQSNLFRDEARELSILGVEEAVQRYYQMDRIERALEDLPLTYRTPLILRYYGGLSYKEIAARMDLSLAATKFRLHHGVKFLKALVMKQ